MKGKKDLFREKSLKRFASPKELDSYLRVVEPGAWVVLAAVLLLIAGGLVWSIFGKLETRITAPLVSQNGQALVYISPEHSAAISTDTTVELGMQEYRVSDADAYDAVLRYLSDTDTDLLRIGGFSVGEEVLGYPLDGAPPDGVYEAVLVTERVSPVRFLLQ